MGISPTATTRSVLGGSLQGNDLLGDSLPELIEVIHCDANARAPITKNEIAANFLAILAVGIMNECKLCLSPLRFPQHSARAVGCSRMRIIRKTKLRKT